MDGWVSVKTILRIAYSNKKPTEKKVMMRRTFLDRMLKVFNAEALQNWIFIDGRTTNGQEMYGQESINRGQNIQRGFPLL